MKYKILITIAFSALMQASTENTQASESNQEKSIQSSGKSSFPNCVHLAQHIAPTALQHIILGYLDSWEEKQTLIQQDFINSIVFSPNSRYFAVNDIACYGLINIWECDNNDNWKPLMNIEVLPPRDSSYDGIETTTNAPVMTIRFGARNPERYIFHNNTIILWGKNSEKEQIINQNHKLQIDAAGFSDNGLYAAFIFKNDPNSIKLWKLNENDIWQEIQTITCSAHSNLTVALSKDNKYTALIIEQTIKICNTNDHSKTVQTLNGNSNVKTVAVSSNFQYLASATNKTIKIWTTQARELIKENPPK